MCPEEKEVPVHRIEALCPQLQHKRLPHKPLVYTPPGFLTQNNVESLLLIHNPLLIFSFLKYVLRCLL